MDVAIPHHRSIGSMKPGQRADLGCPLSARCNLLQTTLKNRATWYSNPTLIFHDSAHLPKWVQKTGHSYGYSLGMLEQWHIDQ